MSRKSSSVDRVVAVLNFFLEHPHQAFTLSQIVKSLQLNRATTLSILLSFVDAGYLFRRSDKSYVLGPALPTLAADALPHISPRSVASHEIRGLADGLGVVASLLVLEENEIVALERAASVKQLGIAGRILQHRYPLHPLGSVFLIPASREELVAKLDAQSPPLSSVTRQDVLTQLEFAQRHGFIVALLPEGQDPTLAESPIACFVSELELNEKYHVRYLIAPVFGAARDVAYAVALFGFTEEMTPDDIFEAGGALVHTCAQITKFIRGRGVDSHPNPARDRHACG